MALSPSASTLEVVEEGPRDCRGDSSRLSGRSKPNREDLRDAGLDRLGHAGASASGSNPATDLVSHENRKSVHEKSRTQAVKQAQCFDSAPSCPNFSLETVSRDSAMFQICEQGRTLFLTGSTMMRRHVLHARDSPHSCRRKLDRGDDFSLSGLGTLGEESQGGA